PHGTVIVFSRGYITAGLDVHHERFLYGEEVAVARRCWERGVPVVYDPAARVRHLGHATTGRMPSRELTRRKREGVWFVQRELAHVRRARGAASERATP
ncbi:glycosyltransferase family 2 protein, partial [Pseudonocardia sp.]|uniref:glycosyltransferase family 2 protein n=1 Tax=Pseudonocardia sp. TaxID=60912 RepID=UPI003D139769